MHSGVPVILIFILLTIPVCSLINPSSRVSVKLTEEIADYVQNVCCIGQILLILSSKKVKIGHNYEVYRTFTA